MSHRSSLVIASCLATLAVATPVRAQHLEMVRASGGYSQLGFGGGNFKLTCDSNCAGNQLSASDISLLFGHQFGARLRFELGGHYQRNTDQSSNISYGSVGFSYYLVGNLYVRGGGTWNQVDVEDANGNYKGSGGPGFTVGAGYELFFGDRVALTPYVNYASASLSKIDRTSVGGATITTAGTLHALNFGVSIGRSSRRPYMCVTAGGDRIRLSSQNAVRFQECLRTWVERLQQLQQERQQRRR